MALIKYSLTDRKSYTQLRRIADSLEFMAMYLAKKENIQYTPSSARIKDNGKEEAEVLHTDDADMLAIRLREYAEFRDTGFMND